MDRSDGEEGLSLDPRTWGGSGAPDPAGGAPGQMDFKPDARGPGAGPRKLKVAMLAGGTLAVLAALVGGYFYVVGQDRDPAAAAESAGEAARSERRVLVIAEAQGLAQALKDAGVPGAQADTAAAAALAALPTGKGDIQVEASFRRLDGGLDLLSLQARFADGVGVSLERRGATYRAEALASDLRTEFRVVRGEMDAESFYSAAVAAGLHDSLVQTFAAAFAFDFDFQREIAPGDVFEASYEEAVSQQGEAGSARRLVYVSLTTREKSRALYWFEARKGWFDGAGRSVVRSFMRTPVEGARISSTFGPRHHPVLGYTRVHKGTDFAVPIGVKVYASGDGKVIIARPGRDFGNWVRLQHKDGVTTTYAHLSAYAPNITEGASVHQGQELGLSGNTGLSSGPHLHYELAIDGVQVDPMTHVTSEGETLTGEQLKIFMAERDRIDGLRAQAS